MNRCRPASASERWPRLRPLPAFLPLALAAWVLTGCELQRTSAFRGGRPYDRVSYLSSGPGLVLRIGPSNLEQDEFLIAADSYLIGPDGEHFRIEAEPFAFDSRPDRDPRLKSKRTLISRLDAEGERVSRSWPDGVWTLVAAVRGADGVVQRLTFDVALGHAVTTPLDGRLERL